MDGVAGAGGMEVWGRTRASLTSGNILKTSVVTGRMPLVSTSYLSLVPAGVFLLVVNRNDGALQHLDRDALQRDTTGGGGAGEIENSWIIHSGMYIRY